MDYKNVDEKKEEIFKELSEHQIYTADLTKLQYWQVD
jgi:hypothetical protein